MSTRYQFVDDSGETRLAGFLVPEPGGSSAVLLVRVPVSSAELLALDVTPKTLVAAPGVGNIVMPVLAISSYLAGAAPYAYAGGNGLTFGWPGSSFNVNSGYGITSTLDSFGVPIEQTTSAVAFHGFAPKDYDNINATASLLNNAPFQVSMDSNPVTGGNGSLVISLLYAVVSLT